MSSNRNDPSSLSINAELAEKIRTSLTMEDGRTSSSEYRPRAKEKLASLKNNNRSVDISNQPRVRTTNNKRNTKQVSFYTSMANSSPVSSVTSSLTLSPMTPRAKLPVLIEGDFDFTKGLIKPDKDINCNMNTSKVVDNNSNIRYSQRLARKYELNDDAVVLSKEEIMFRDSFTLGSDSSTPCFPRAA